jgi:methionine synthase II (cobalamin-independent)
VVTKQREIGIDVISNGEQQRESFVLYLRRRLSARRGPPSVIF